MTYETVDTVAWVGLGATAAHLLIIIVIGVRVLMRRRAPGSSAAWLLLVITLPYLGAVLYLMIGERRLGGRRAERAMLISEPVRRWIGALPERAGDDHEPVIERWSRVRHLADTAVGMAALPGNQLELLADTERILRAIISDIERAGQFCLLEFYIWNPGGTADDVAEALVRAAQRGVRCQVLVDAVGGKAFFRSSWPRRMRAANVEVRAALPAGVIRTLFRRIDLRLHRKLVVVDGHVAYTGSLNLVDPRYFKQGAGVGQWVDAMARIEGPAVEALACLLYTSDAADERG